MRCIQAIFEVLGAEEGARFLYPIFYSARRLYDLKSPMEAEDLAHPKLVSDLDFHNIIYATMIARYGKAVMDASKEAPEWAMC